MREEVAGRTPMTLEVLLPLALVLLKGEGKFTARMGRVKIYCRASVDGHRPYGSRGVPSEVVKLCRKSNNDCQRPTQTCRGRRRRRRSRRERGDAAQLVLSE